MRQLSNVSVFIKIVESGSFAAAAKDLGISKSAVSKQVVKLEESLGVPLLNRTTRKLTLTEPGQFLFERSRALVDEFESLERDVANFNTTPRGLLRLSVANTFAAIKITPLLGEFYEKYPDIKIEFVVDSRKIDLISNSIDLAIRIGKLSDSSLIARKIGSSPRHICASPSYWQRHAKPKHPNDLQHHNCLTYSSSENPNAWEFKDGLVVPVNGTLKANSGDIILQAVLQGYGVAQLPGFTLENAFKQGLIEEVLTDFPAPMLDIYAVFPENRVGSKKVRVFIDFLVGKL